MCWRSRQAGGYSHAALTHKGAAHGAADLRADADREPLAAVAALHWNANGLDQPPLPQLQQPLAGAAGGADCVVDCRATGGDTQRLQLLPQRLCGLGNMRV